MRCVGAVVEGVDLTRPLDGRSVETIRQTVLDHGVAFLRGQVITREQMADFMANFGTLVPDPMAVEQKVRPVDSIIDIPTLAYRAATAVWHTDSTLAETPSSMIALRPIALPSIGGDTCWGDMYSAYEALSAPLRDMLDKLTAVHSAAKVMPLVSTKDTPRGAPVVTRQGLPKEWPTRVKRWNWRSKSCLRPSRETSSR